MGGPAVLILIGIILLLGNLRLLDWAALGHYFSRYWPLLLIFWGLIRLFEHFPPGGPDATLRRWARVAFCCWCCWSLRA
jgi:hypothetical protein